jgi:hypothetical protein
MNIRAIVQELEYIVECHAQIAKEILGHPYGRGWSTGISVDEGATFECAACSSGCCGTESYSIPLDWLEMDNESFRAFLIAHKIKQEEERQRVEKGKKENETRRLKDLRLRQYEQLKKEFEK